MDCSPPGSSVQGILQARTLERGAMLSSRGSSRPRDQTSISYVSALAGRLFATSATWEALCCLQKQAPAQDTLGRSGHRPRHASSAHGCKATRVWVLDTCSVGDQVTWADLENIAGGGSSGERTCILTNQAHVPGFLALSHRLGLPEPSSQEPGVPPSAPWHIHLPPPSVDKGISSPGSPDADSHSG